MRPEAVNWIKQARADFKTAKDCLESRNYYAAAFFSHQCVEKALKSYYVEKIKEAPPKTHNLVELSLRLGIPEDFLHVARELTPEFIIPRYPDAAGAPPFELYDEASARKILNVSERFLEWLEKKIED